MQKDKISWLFLKNLWNIIWWSKFLQLNFIKDFKSSFNSLLWNTIWNNWIIYYVSQARKLSIIPVEYVKKDKRHFADFRQIFELTFLSLMSAYWWKNYILILKKLISLNLRDTLERTSKVISNQNLFSRFQSWCWFWCWSWCLNFV